MRLQLSHIYLIAALALLLILPIGQASVVLVLFVAAVLGAVAMMLREDTNEPPGVITLGGDLASLTLLRRTVPELRMRRPALAIDAQIQWRQEAERRRRQREFGFTLRE